MFVAHRSLHFLAKIRFDTAENEPAQHLQIFAEFANFAMHGYGGYPSSVPLILASRKFFKDKFAADLSRVNPETLTFGIAS